MKLGFEYKTHSSPLLSSPQSISCYFNHNLILSHTTKTHQIKPKKSKKTIKKVANSTPESGVEFCDCALFGGEKTRKKSTKIPSKMEKTDSQKSEMLAGVSNSGNMSFNLGGVDDEEVSMSALSNFRAKEEEIEKKKMEVRERVQAQLGRVEEETKRLALIRGELEALANPMKKDVDHVRKKIDVIKKELKSLGTTVQKKEKEYKEALDAYNEKNKEKVQLINKLVELVGESERLRIQKLDELSKSIDSLA